MSYPSIKVRVKVAAYEKGILPTKMSQLENDSNYVSEEWVKKFIEENGGSFGPNQTSFDGGDIANPSTGAGYHIDGGDIASASTAGKAYDFGDISNL